MAKYVEHEPDNINIIVNGTEITGDLASSGGLRIDGKLVGNINAKGKVVIGETGNIKGEIHCKNADVSGKLEGKITVSEQLSLKATSVINGDINTNKLAIEPGAKFTGTCNMSGDSVLNEIGKPQEKPIQKNQGKP